MAAKTVVDVLEEAIYEIKNTGWGKGGMVLLNKDCDPWETQDPVVECEVKGYCAIGALGWAAASHNERIEIMRGQDTGGLYDDALYMEAVDAVYNELPDSWGSEGRTTSKGPTVFEGFPPFELSFASREGKVIDYNDCKVRSKAQVLKVFRSALKGLYK